MADLNAYWKQVTEAQSFQDLDDDQKEKVREHLFNKYVQTSPSYSGLPQSQRLSVKKHFDDVTKIEPTSMGEDIVKRGKKLVDEAKPIIQKVGQVAALAPVAAEMIEPEPMRKTYEGLTKGAEALSQGGEELGKKIEPTEQQLIEHSKTGGRLTDFDMARMAASGAVKTGADFLATAIPKNFFETASYPLIDKVMEYAGTTFLGKWDILAPFKPKTGLSAEANAVGDQFEKIVTKRRIENNGRQMSDGPPKPLEVLAQKEQALKTQDELQRYEEWLKQADETSAHGGEPAGDLHPEAKVNVSQLRDAAKERLQKLQGEPVRVESLRNAEDALAGYYRRRIDNMRVYMQPSGPKVEPQALLPGGEQPVGLLKEGERPPASRRPTPEQAPREPVAAKSPMVLKAREVLTKAYSAYYPDESKQAIQIRAGAAMKAFDFKPTQELSTQHLEMLDKFMEQEHADYQRSQAAAEVKPQSTSPKAEVSRLHEKGLDPLEVQSEAKRLQDQYNVTAGISDLEKFIKSEGGLKSAPGMEEEHVRNVPKNLYGQVMPDDMAQRAHEANLLPDANATTMYEQLSKRQETVRPRSQRSFLDEAERNIEHRRVQDAGFFSEDQTFSLRGEQGQEAEPPLTPAGEQTTMPGTQAQFPDKPLRDLKQASTFDVVNEIRKTLGETGGGGGEIDPVRQAALEAAVNELVDRAMALGYQTSQDIMLYAARNAPAELQNALRKNLAPTLSPFDTHAYKAMDAAKEGNPIAKKDMMDAAQRNYFQKKTDILRGVYKKFKANQQVVVFKDMDEGLMRLQNDLFIHDNYRKFSKDELAAQRWLIEGKAPKIESLKALGVPEEQAKRWLELARNPTENMKNARKMTQIFEDEYHDLISEYYDKVGYVEDHVTRRWKQDREYLDWEGRTLGNKPNFVKGRKLLSQADGIDAGYEPVSFDIRDDLRASNNTRVNILSRIHAYQKLGASFGPEGMPAIIDESGNAVTQAKNAKITPHQGTAPNSWLRFPNVPMLDGLAINPYYKPAMKFMMARPFQGTTADVLDFLSSSTKATKLIGFFHGYTLGEMLFSGVSYRDVFSFSKDQNVLFRGLRYAAKAMTTDMDGEAFSKNPIKAMDQLYHSFLTGSGQLANRPLALEMAENGFKFGSADEDMHGVLRKSLNKTEDFLKKRIGEGTAKGLTTLPRMAVDIQEAALWRYIRPISSMLVYETNLKDAILKFNLEAEEGKKIPIDELKKAIVNQTSKEMGGISYARLMINPRTQQVLQWAMLAPGWTIGRALMGASVLEKGPEGRQARKQMAKLFVSWFFASNMINYAQTKKYFGKGRYMWENPEGYRNQAFLSKEKDGSTRYMQLSKALTEIYDDIDHPMRTLAYKVGAPAQAAVKVMNWATAKTYSPGIEPENPLAAALHMYEPMVSSGQSAYGGLPVHRGPSKNKIEGVLNEYYKGGMKNNALFEEAMQMATEQGYDISKLDRAVRGARTRKQNAELFK